MALQIVTPTSKSASSGHKPHPLKHAKHLQIALASQKISNPGTNTAIMVPTKQSTSGEIKKPAFNSTSNTAYPQQKSKASPTPQKDHGNFGNTPSPSTAMNWPNNGAKKPSPHTSNHPSRNSKPPQQSLSLLDLRTSGSRR